MDIDVPAIAADVLTGGAILVWFEVDSGVWAPMPFEFRPISSSVVRRWDVQMRTGSLRVLFSLLDIADPTADLDPLVIAQPSRTFRWVIIPPAAAALMDALPVDEGPDATLAELRAQGLMLP